LVTEQVLQHAPHFAVFNGSCSETEVSKQLYYKGTLTSEQCQRKHASYQEHKYIGTFCKLAPRSFTVGK
jgi:hypothetical protein